MARKRSASINLDSGRCLTHRPLTLGYVAWHEEAERRAERGLLQRQCTDCTPPRWYWEDEWGDHEGWDRAEQATVEEIAQ